MVIRLTDITIKELVSSPDFEMKLKASSTKQEVFKPLVEYLKIVFAVEITSQRMFNCETGIYFQFLSLKSKEI
jgi:hypothetical protein